MPWYDIINIGLLTIVWSIALFNLKLTITTRRNWLLFFLVYSATEFISAYFSFMARNNLWLYSVSKPIQYLFVYAYFFEILGAAESKKRVILFIALVSYVLLLGFKNLNIYNSLELVVSDAIVVVFCVIYFKKVIEHNDGITNEFWFCSSLFIWFGSNLWINGAMDFFLVNNLKIAQRLFYVIVGTSYIFYIMIIFALIKSLEKRKSQNG